jgi:hypothetical protein
MMKKPKFRQSLFLARTPPFWPFLIICAAAGSLVSLGEVHKFHCSDTLVPILASLQKWTPFFWEQDRIGMLVPLLTLPIRHPLLNLLAQEAIYVSTALAAMFLLARYMLRDDSYALVGTLSAVACLSLVPVSWFSDFTTITLGGVWLALGLGGLVLTKREPGFPTSWWRWAIALGLLVLAHWVYSATALLLGPLVVARFLICRQESKAPDAQTDDVFRSTWDSTPKTLIQRVVMTEAVGQLILLGVGFGMGVLFFRLSTRHAVHHTDLSTLPVAQWPNTWRQLWDNQWSSLTPHHWPYFLFGIAFAGSVSFLHPTTRRQPGVAGRAGIAVAIAAIVYFLFMGTRRWTALNSCCPRYTHPSIFLLQGGLALLASGQVTSGLKDRLNRHPYVVAATGLLLAAFINFHSPSIKKVRSDLLHTYGLGGRTDDVLAARCTHVAGDYWKVWPTVFHANLLLREQGESRTVWGITLRGEPTHGKWQHMPLEELRIAVPVDDREQADAWLQSFHLPAMMVVERRSTIYVLRPAAVVLREQHQNLPGDLDPNGAFRGVAGDPKGKPVRSTEDH